MKTKYLICQHKIYHKVITFSYILTLFSLFSCNHSKKIIKNKDSLSQTVTSKEVKNFGDDTIYNEMMTSMEDEHWYMQKQASEQLAENAFQIMLKQNSPLKSFYQKLVTDTVLGKDDIIRYILKEYPIIVSGNEGKEIHHHHVTIPPQNEKLITKKTFGISKQDTFIYYRTYKLNFMDFKLIEIKDYDNLRYIWWNPYVENFRDAKRFRDLPAYFIQNSDQNEVNKTWILSYAKYFFNRSPENLLKYYQYYKKNLISLLPLSEYKALKLDITVNNLLKAHSYFKKKNAKQFLDDGYLETFGKKIVSHNGDKFDVRNIHWSSNYSWYFTFWIRREKESNVEAVLTILKDIQKIYQ